MIGIGLFELIIVLMVLALHLFWIVMHVDCALYEPSGADKMAWVIIIAVTNFLGAAFYLFIRRPLRISQFGQ